MRRMHRRMHKKIKRHHKKILSFIEAMRLNGGWPVGA